MSLLINPIVIDNFISKEYQESILQSIKNIAWWYNPHTSDIDGDSAIIDGNTIDSPQFMHFPLDVEGRASNAFDTLRPMVGEIERYFNNPIEYIFRIKISCLNRNILSFGKDNYNTPHVDTDVVEPDFISLIYYINNCDGDTFIFNEKYGTPVSKFTTQCRVTPRQGRVVIFNSNQFHASSNPIQEYSRFIINFVFKIKRYNE